MTDYPIIDQAVADQASQIIITDLVGRVALSTQQTNQMYQACNQGKDNMATRLLEERGLLNAAILR